MIKTTPCQNVPLPGHTICSSNVGKFSLFYRITMEHLHLSYLTQVIEIWILIYCTYVLYHLRNVHFTFCDGIRFVMLYIM